MLGRVHTDQGTFSVQTNLGVASGRFGVVILAGDRRTELACI